MMAKVGIQSFARTHFGSYFDAIFLMYLVSSGFSFKSSSSTQFSQELVVSVQKGGCKTFNKSKFPNGQNVCPDSGRSSRQKGTRVGPG